MRLSRTCAAVLIAFTMSAGATPALAQPADDAMQATSPRPGSSTAEDRSPAPEQTVPDTSPTAPDSTHEHSADESGGFTQSPATPEAETPQPAATGDTTATEPAPATETATGTSGTEEATAEKTLTIEPGKLSASDFVREDAVIISATGCQPDADATMTVIPQGMNVGNYSETATVDADGAVAFSVHGQHDMMAQTYAGDYAVTVACAGNDQRTGSFTVTADAAPTPSAEPTGTPGGQHGRGARLPRTGSDLLAAAAGAILLTVGTASVVFTRRRG
ncbi:hypothetical protein [Brevibacterium gallinarum]|uniref:Gram-positive cocci surface proteins LPxTG domain-containing protein n=1 Tax=Brevibacterium gallinarum TaxID=2762220 RepID=A0ABR8WXM2_9MICO|nr:hypothetical protein [Brevibacterium gallinarum]MBD8021842.1 hypothetical protein [Brevibacterium gallinarum]